MIKSEKGKGFLGTAFVLIASVLWGALCLTSRPLSKAGFNSIQITGIRAFIATIVLSAFFLVKDRSLFKIKLKHIPIFLGTGVASFLFFNFCYMWSLYINTVSFAATLLYTSPIWIAVLSRIIFKEKITVSKIIALVFALGGTVLLSVTDIKLTPLGLLLGIGSGFGYALYSIFSKFALRHYKPVTTIFYTFLFAFIFFIPADLMFSVFATDTWVNPVTLLIGEPINILLLAVNAVFCTVLPYVFYTLALSLIPAGRAGILAIAELVVASVFGWIFLGDAFNVLSLIGILIVVAALIFMEIMQSKGK